MRKVLLTLAAVVSLGAIAACADAPGTAPQIAGTPSEFLGIPGTGTIDSAIATVSSPIVSTALRRTTPLATDLTATALIGDAGGVIAIPAAGVRLEIPRGALRTSTQITVRALAGSLVAYEFGPHGKQFKRSLRITQDLAGTNWLQVNLLGLEAVYFKDKSQVDQVTGTITVDEVLPAMLDLLRGRVGFEVQHFSGYAVSTGRSKGSATGDGGEGTP